MKFVKLTPTQELTLNTLKSFKSFAREENYNYEAPRKGITVSYKDSIDSLVSIGLVKINKRGAITPTLNYEEMSLLLCAQNVNEVETLAEIDRLTKSHLEQKQKAESMPFDVWPREDRGQAMQSANYTLKQANFLKSVLKLAKGQ